jgi:hypothetical protein
MTDKSNSNNVPESITTHFNATHPGVVVITWQPMADYWYTTYKSDNNRLIRVYYNTQPWYMMRNESFGEALPVLNTFVPDAVITSAINNYGDDLYSITTLKATAGSEGNYAVTILKNGVSDRIMMNGQGVVLNVIKKTSAAL